MKKIALFQSDLQVGGIQKSLLNLLNLIDLTEHEVDLFLFSKGNFFRSSIPSKVNVYEMEAYPSYNKLMPFSVVKKMYGKSVDRKKQYDVAIDFNSYWNECAVGAICANAKRRIMWIHTDIERRYEDNKKFRVLFNQFKSKFKYYDEFVAVSQGAADAFRAVTGINDKKITVIPNLVNVKEILSLKEEKIDFSPDADCVNIMAMGYLAPVKGYDEMLKHMKEACQARDDLRLYIIGDGPLKEELHNLCAQYAIDKKVYFLGNQQNPYRYLQKADAFIMTSRYEGQGIALREAQCLGLQLLFPKRLEKYNDGLKGCENLTDAMIHLQKAEKNPDMLTEYTENILRSFSELVGADS